MGFFLETLLGGLMAGMLYSLVALGLQGYGWPLRPAWGGLDLSVWSWM